MMTKVGLLLLLICAVDGRVSQADQMLVPVAMTKKCSTYTCTTANAVNRGATDGTQCRSTFFANCEQRCCAPTTLCTQHNCPDGEINKGGTLRYVTGDTQDAAATCCVESCTRTPCSNGYKYKSDVAPKDRACVRSGDYKDTTCRDLCCDVDPCFGKNCDSCLQDHTCEYTTQGICGPAGIEAADILVTKTDLCPETLANQFWIQLGADILSTLDDVRLQTAPYTASKDATEKTIYVSATITPISSAKVTTAPAAGATVSRQAVVVPTAGLKKGDPTNNIRGGKLPAAGGPDWFFTAMLNGCTFVAKKAGDGGLIVAHVQPAVGWQNGQEMEQAIKTNGSFDHETPGFDFVFGKQDYALGTNADLEPLQCAVFGHRKNAKWSIFAQCYNRGGGFGNVQDIPPFHKLLYTN